MTFRCTKMNNAFLKKFSKKNEEEKIKILKGLSPEIHDYSDILLL